MDENRLLEVRRLPADRRLRLTWADGHSAEYDYDYLRGFCPCAGCQGHTAEGVRFKPTQVPVEPTRIDPVGNYAISFVWSDGHGTGIYRFEFLRQICPCHDCRTAGVEPAPGGDPAAKPS